MAREQTQLVIGRGEVWFEAFLPDTKQGLGERYLGNTTTFQVGRKVARLDRFTSYGGQKVEVAGALVSEEHNVIFITDNISLENVGDWFSGEVVTQGVPAVGLITETIAVKLGSTVQLGRSVHITGVRSVENLVVERAGVVVSESGNYSLDATTGRLTIAPQSPIIQDGDTLAVTFEWRRAELTSITSRPREIHGALRFISYNAYGAEKHHFYPYVRLAARGQVDLKGDEWQQIPFEVSVLRLNPFTEQVYVEETAQIFFLEDEQAILDSGLTIEEFPIFGNDLDVLVNSTMPSHNY